MHDDVVNQLIRNGRQGRLAVAGFPCIPHWLQHFAAAEPLVESGIHGHVEIGRNRELARSAHHISVLAGAHKDATHNLFLLATGSIVHYGGHLGHVLRRQPVNDRAIGLARRKFQHAFAQRRHQNLWLLLWAHAQTKPIDLERVVLLRHLFSAERILQEAHDIAHLLIRLYKRHAVPALDNHVAARANANRKSTRRGVGHAGHTLRKACWRTRVGRHDCGAQTKAGLPRCGHRQRRKGIGAIALGRPNVGVPQIGEFAELFAVAMQRPRQRHGHTRTLWKWCAHFVSPC